MSHYTTVVVRLLSSLLFRRRRRENRGKPVPSNCCARPLNGKGKRACTVTTRRCARLLNTYANSIPVNYAYVETLYCLLSATVRLQRVRRSATNNKPVDKVNIVLKYTIRTMYTRRFRICRCYLFCFVFLFPLPVFFQSAFVLNLLCWDKERTLMNFELFFLIHAILWNIQYSDMDLFLVHVNAFFFFVITPFVLAIFSRKVLWHFKFFMDRFVWVKCIIT